MEITNILTLSDGNKYMVTSKIKHNCKLFLCLVDIDNSQNIKFGYLNNDEIVIVKKEELSRPLVLKLLYHIKNSLQKLIN